MTTQLEVVAQEVATVDEAVMKVLPFVSEFIGFVPGAAVAVPFLPLLGELLQALDNAAKAVAKGDPSGGVEVVLKMIMAHLTPNQPNSPILSGPMAPMPGSLGQGGA